MYLICREQLKNFGGTYLTDLNVGPIVKLMRIATGGHMTMIETIVTCLYFVLKLIIQNHNL